MRVIKEINAFQKGFNSVQKGGKIGPDAASNWAKGMFTGKTDKKDKSKGPNNYTHWFNDGKGVKWSFDSKTGMWVSPTGQKAKKKVGIKAFNNAKKRSSDISLNTESTMAKTNEGLGDLAHVVEKDHEVQMARAQLYKIAKHAIQLHDMMQGMDPDTDLESWVQAKLTKSADYIDSVYHHLDAKNAAKAEEMDVLETAIKRARDTGSKADVYKATLEAKMNTKYLKQKGLTGDKAKDSKAYAKPRGKMPPPTIVMKNKKSDKHDARGKIKDID